MNCGENLGCIKINLFIFCKIFKFKIEEGIKFSFC